jgi:hypothetical protein
MTQQIYLEINLNQLRLNEPIFNCTQKLIHNFRDWLCHLVKNSYFGQLAKITPDGCNVPRASGILKVHPKCRFFWGCWAPPVIMSSLPKLWRNGCFSVSTSIEETEKSRVAGERQSCKLPVNSVNARYRDSTANSLSPHFGEKQSPHNIIINYLAFQDEFFCEQSAWCQRNW